MRWGGGRRGSPRCVCQLSYLINFGWFLFKTTRVSLHISLATCWRPPDWPLILPPVPVDWWQVLSFQWPTQVTSKPIINVTVLCRRRNEARVSVGESGKSWGFREMFSSRLARPKRHVVLVVSTPGERTLAAPWSRQFMQSTIQEVNDDDVENLCLSDAATERADYMMPVSRLPSPVGLSARQTSARLPNWNNLIRNM